MTAARNGMALCIAQFIHSTVRVDLVRLYCEHFTPRRPEDEPTTSVCAMVATADAPTDARTRDRRLHPLGRHRPARGAHSRRGPTSPKPAPPSVPRPVTSPSSPARTWTSPSN